MDNNEIWFILTKLSNDKKINIIKKYNDELNVNWKSNFRFFYWNRS